MIISKKGFTIIELIVVIAIIAVLAAIVLTSVSQYTNKSKIARAKADAANIGKALMLFYSAYGDYPTSGFTSFPITYGAFPLGGIADPYLGSHYLSEFYKNNWNSYTATYYSPTSFYGLNLTDTDSDGKVGCVTVNLLGGSPVTSSGLKYIICQDCPTMCNVASGVLQ